MKYILYLVQNNKGKGVIYAKGLNDCYQCGINSEEEKIDLITKVDIDDNLDFKYICTYDGFSAALTSCGKIFVWGDSNRYISFFIKIPCLIEVNEDSITLSYRIKTRVKQVVILLSNIYKIRLAIKF